MKLIRKNNKKGFTLVELIVVIAIIAILALILIPAITGYVGRAEDSSLVASARAAHTKAVVIVSEEGTNDLANKIASESNDKVIISAVVTPGTAGSEDTYVITAKLKGKNKQVTIDQTGKISEVDKVSPSR